MYYNNSKTTIFIYNGNKYMVQKISVLTSLIQITLTIDSNLLNSFGFCLIQACILANY